MGGDPKSSQPIKGNNFFFFFLLWYNGKFNNALLVVAWGQMGTVKAMDGRDANKYKNVGPILGWNRRPVRKSQEYMCRDWLLRVRGQDRSYKQTTNRGGRFNCGAAVHVKENARFFSRAT